MIKTAKALVLEGILPCSDDTVRALAKRHGIGRMLGRTLIFTPEDITRLLESLPRPSGPFGSIGPATGGYAGPSQTTAYERALEMALAKRPRKKARR